MQAAYDCLKRRAEMMDESEDKIRSVKNELDKFFERFMEAYQKTPDGLPKRPMVKDADQAVYVGEPSASGWCRWKPVPYGEEEAFIKLLETYGIEKRTDIVEYFCAYHSLGFDVKYKKNGIAISTVDPRDGYRVVKQRIGAYTDQDRKVTHIAIGLEEKVGYSVVVEVKTGIVKFVDEDRGKMRKVAPSLEEFVKGWEPWV